MAQAGQGGAAAPTPRNVRDKRPQAAACPACGQPNAPDAARCATCWTALDRHPSDFAREHARALRKRDRVLAALAGAIALVALIALALWLRPDPVLAPPATAWSAEQTADAWPMLHGGPSHRGAAPSAAPVSGAVAWTASLGAPASASPAVANGAVYAASEAGVVAAYSLDDGRPLWRYDAGSPIETAPAAAGEFVYAGTRGGRLLALDAETGAARWEFETRNPVFASPVVHRGTLYLGGADGFLYALDAQTGALRWDYDAGGWIIGAPAVNAAVVAVAAGGAAHLIDVKTGKKRFVFESAGPVADSPVLGDGALYAASGDGRVWAIDSSALEYPLEKGFHFWRTNLYAWGMLNEPPAAKGLLWARRLSSEPLQTSPALADGALYVTAPGGELHALRADTGEPLWSVDTGAAYLSAPTLNGAVVLVGSERGLHAVDARDGAARLLHATAAPVESPPALASGRVVLLTADGTLTALR